MSREQITSRITKRHVEKRIDIAMKNVYAEITGSASGGRIARGLAGEGYAGGYMAALNDVLLVMNGASPCGRPYYWVKP